MTDKFECVCCKNKFDKNDGINTSDGDLICKGCEENEYSNCYGCGELFHADEITISNINEECYCDDCHSDTFANCDGCGRECYSDDLCYNEDYEEYYCERCS